MQQNKEKPTVEEIGLLASLLLQFLNFFRGTPEKRHAKALRRWQRRRDDYLELLFGQASAGGIGIADIPTFMDAWEDASPRPKIEDYR